MLFETSIVVAFEFENKVFEQMFVNNERRTENALFVIVSVEDAGRNTVVWLRRNVEIWW